MDAMEFRDSLRKISELLPDRVKQFYYDSFPIAAFIITYGFILTIPAHSFLGVSFSLPNILSFGIIFYFLKKEIPSIYLVCSGMKQA